MKSGATAHPSPDSAAGVAKQESVPTAGPPPQVTQAPQSIPPLSAVQVNAGILADGAAGAWPLTRRGHVLEVSRRVSATENPEVFAVFVDVATEADAEVATLSDFSRLFKPELNPVEFSLVQFNQADGRLHRMRSFPLGKYMVFESLRIVPIRKGFDMPFAASVTFQTQEGSDDVWETFSQSGTSQITLQQTLSRSPIVEDIDGDGYLDIIIKERGIEEGTGYETFLTWYKWDGTAYKEYQTTNIVRNLRDFLSSAAELLSSDKIDEFFRASIPAGELDALKSEGQSPEEIFKMIFHLIPSSPDNPNLPLSDIGAIERVIFPNIFENPFTEQDERGYSFPMTVRMVSDDGASHFYAAKVYMHRNPFIAPQFSFSVERN
ncbi:MAG TPA: hypothetical protein VMW69_02095 [Spirochaetia bacterium]|nr:hypothetical protein [Spirochaetia bacterium]